LMKDGRYFDPYLPAGNYAELRILTNTRAGLINTSNAVKNQITAMLDEYYPEIWKVFKKPLEGKVSRQILKSCPFPSLILTLDESAVLAEVRKAVKRTVGIKKVRELIATAKSSIGVEYGMLSARLRLSQLLEDLERYERQLGQIEDAMRQALKATGYAEQLLSIKGIGVITAASFLGEVGDPLRFENARQIANYAGYNLVEDSSGKSKGKTHISKRGRSQLRRVLYQMAFTMVGQNTEMKALYHYLIERKENPLKKKQALVVVSKKIITVIHSLLKKRTTYNPDLVLGSVRKELMQAA